MLIFPVQLTTSRIGNLTRSVDPYSAICDDHTYIYTCLVHTLLLIDGGLNVLYCIVISYQSHILILQHCYPVIPVAAKGLLSLPVTRATVPY